jgi:4-diphosphocytidyl-2C-methyl-D-erythritol kinase
MAPELVRNQMAVNVNDLKEQTFWINDFMPVVLRQFPEVRKIYQLLKAKMRLRLSGSGSTLFALFDDLSAAEQAQQSIAEICKSQLVRPQMSMNQTLY